MLIKEKIAQAVVLLKEFDLDCWITFTRESAINGDPVLPFLVEGSLTWHSALIVTRTGFTAAVVGEYDRRSVEDLDAYGEVISYVKGFGEPFQSLMKKINPATIALNYSAESEICDGITHGMYLTMVELLAGIGMQDRIVQADRIVSALRQRKTGTEIRAIGRAIAQTLEIYGAVAGFVRPGRSEREIAGFVREEMTRRNLEPAWDVNTCPAVFTGPDTAAAHYAPTERLVERGHVLNMDFGVRVDGYCSDLQRTFYVLAPGEVRAPGDVQRGFDTIVNAIEMARRAMRPGVQGIEVDRVARDFVTSLGYPEFPHALGHQVGRFAHDGTALLGPAWEKYARKPFYPLEPGMVFTLEPRLPVEGKGIATIEEMVVVTTSGADWLSAPQKELVLIPSGV
jgi:Xaa-Pro aminopeptidase